MEMVKADEMDEFLKLPQSYYHQKKLPENF
jgi:hypothetical protein